MVDIRIRWNQPNQSILFEGYWNFADNAFLLNTRRPLNLFSLQLSQHLMVILKFLFSGGMNDIVSILQLYLSYRTFERFKNEVLCEFSFIEWKLFYLLRVF